MLTVIGIIVAITPFLIVFGLLIWTSQRERRRRDARARQVALTDTIYERLGAAAAPLVRRRGRGWQVRIALSLERLAICEALVAIVLESFAPPGCDRGLLEIVLTLQPEAPASNPAAARGAMSSCT